MSRFNSEIKVLEQHLKKYQKELQQLHDENASLKQREEGLCRSLVTLQCGMTALASAASQQSSASQDSSGVLEGGRHTPEDSTTAAAGQDSPAGPGFSPQQQSQTPHSGSSQPALEGAWACPPFGTGGAARPPSWSSGRVNSGSSAEVPSGDVCGSLPSQQQQQQQPAQQQQQQQQGSVSDVVRVEGQLQALTVMLEGMMAQISSLAPSQAPLKAPAGSTAAAGADSHGVYGDCSSGGGSSAPHPSGHVAALRLLAADPQRVLAYLALSTEERSIWLASAVRRLALLLPKYGAVHTSRAELTRLSQEIVMRGLTYSWLDPGFCALVDLNLLNMETGQMEPGYPDGFWEFVAQSLSLTPQQRLALSALFRRIKAAHTALLQQHDTLLQQLQGLQQQRHQEQLWFAQQAHQLPILRTAQALGRCRQGEGEVLPQGQQQQQGLALPPHQQQQQHPRWWQELEQMQVQQEQQEPPLFPVGGCLMDRLNCASDIVLTDPMVAGASYPEFAQQPQQPPLQQQQRRRQPHLQLLLDPLLVSSDPCLDVLLAPPSPDQRRLEAQLSALRDRVALGEQLLAAQLLTMLDPKQLAQLVVSSWPFCPDSLALAEAVDKMG